LPDGDDQADNGGQLRGATAAVEAAYPPADLTGSELIEDNPFQECCTRNLAETEEKQQRESNRGQDRRAASSSVI